MAAGKNPVDKPKLDIITGSGKTITTKEEAVKIAREKALATLLASGSCAYSTVLALQDVFGLKDETLLKASGALTGGIGGQTDTCGSMIGATLVLGAVYGGGRTDGENCVPKIFEAARQAAEYYKWFKAKMGTANCHDILTVFAGGVQYDYTNREQLIVAIEAGVLEKCHSVVQDNAGKAAAILWDELHKPAAPAKKKHERTTR
jgi:C_GCAxxG_C_C family probable redox protein